MSRTYRRAFIFTLLGLAGITGLSYRRWLNDCTRQLEDGSTVAETSKGLVEYALFGDAGPAILFVHGQPGGYDQGELLGAAVAQHGFRMITISRPGYLRTPLDTGRSPGEQADAFAVLLDALGIQQVAVVSLSGGGPAAIQFCLRHPSRCLALVAIAAVSLPKNPPQNIVSWLLASRLLTSNFAGWLIGIAVKLRPSLLAQVLMPGSSSQAEVLADPQKRSALITIAQAGIRLPARRRAGSRNDVEQFAKLPVLPVEAMRVPTLVIHGTHDKLVPFTHGLFMARTVPGAELDAIEGGTHAIVVTHVDPVFSRLFAFLDKHGRNRPYAHG